ncbi:MAG: orotate phosphoribosyltransferase [Candidatus Auribacter fodinae]|jgi:orotate phosphoribosyltransferase|uniref:Orotate phosphoribosyltransferase n=1 Tax=Candidatus Auribacter fodinae TaxID=2093366 RepID=A0A3A4R1I8_9BACT|nr:MAG: orotate phosphoribosyltransferase [Candidatus Auribacter fodinae]
MDKNTLLSILKESEAMLEGHFILSSGLHSNRYVQCAKLLQYPQFAAPVGEAIADHFRDKGITCVVGPALGGVIIAYKVAEALNVRSIFGERQNEQMCLRRGFSVEKGEKLLLVEDVITTGKSVKELYGVVKACGAEVVGIGSIIDRSGGNALFDCEFFSLLHLDIQTWQADQCPPEFAAIPAVKPGSRGLK